jgi:hypothetical protein
MWIEPENDLEKYLILCQECGFGLTRHELRVLAFNFMESLGFAHRFNRTQKMAAWEWMYSFFKRHPMMHAVCKENKLSLNRALGMSRSEVKWEHFSKFWKEK